MQDVQLAYISGNSTGKTIAYSVSNYEFTKRGFVGDKPKFSYISSGQQASNFEKIFKEIKNGKLPAGSIENCDYSANFCIDDEAVINVNFKDYRGKMLVEDESAESNMELQRMLKASEVLVMIIPGDLINNYIRMIENRVDATEEIKIESAIREQMMIVRRTLSIVGNNENGQKKPILFYITKSDMIPYNDRKKMDSLFTLLREFNLIASQRKVLFCHSTLGRNLDLDDFNQVRSIKTIQPEGFEMPLLLAVGHVLSKKGMEWENSEYKKLEEQKISLQQNIDNLQQERGKESGKISFKIRNMFSSTNMLSFYDKEIASARKKLEQANNEQTQLSQKNKLKQYSNDILSYIKSKNLDDEQLYVIYINENGQERPLEEFFI